MNNTELLQQALDAYNCGHNVMADCLDVDQKKFMKMLNGTAHIPDGLIDDLRHAVPTTLEYVRSVIEANPELKNISYAFFKIVLAEYEKDDTMTS